MSKELSAKAYRPGHFTVFAITDPKLREVWAADFKDRITHHLLVSKIEPIWEKMFIHDSYACRKDKGAHKAIHKIKKILANDPDFYYLHVDVRGFFTNIDRKVLFSLLSKKVKNPDLLYLIKLIVFHDPKSNYIIKGDRKLLFSIPKHKSLFGVADGKGLPIGNYTSQFFANVYLNELDQYAKRILKCRHYFRYMDDILILEKNREKLASCIKAIDLFLKSKLNLELHTKKTILQRADKGINFLGFIIRPAYTLSRKRVVGNLKTKLREINSNLEKLGRLGNNEELEDSVKKAQGIVNSYWAHFRHGDCVRLKNKIYTKHFGNLAKYLEPIKPTESHLVLKNDSTVGCRFEEN